MTNDDDILRHLLSVFMSIRIIVMATKIVLGLSMLIIGSIIVIACDWLIPTFDIYSPDSVIYIASIFMVYCVIEIFLLKLTPASLLSVTLLLPLIIIYAIFKHTNPLVFTKSVLADIRQHTFQKPCFDW